MRQDAQWDQDVWRSRKVPRQGRARRRRAGSWMRPVGLGVVLAGLLAIVLALARPGPLTCIRDIAVEIQGPGTLTEEEVRGVLTASPGTSFLELDWDAAGRAIQALPRVKRVRLSYTWFNRLEVKVEEHAAVALILRPDAAALEVSEDGVLMSPRGRSLADLPLLSWEDVALMAAAPEAGGRLEVRGAPDLLGLLATMQHGYPALWEGVSQAHLMGDGCYELYWNDIPTVVWGRGGVSDMRLRAWSSVMGDLRRRGETDAVVDLRFRDQIVVHLPVDRADAAAHEMG